MRRVTPYVLLLSLLRMTSAHLPEARANAEPLPQAESTGDASSVAGEPPAPPGSTVVPGPHKRGSSHPHTALQQSPSAQATFRRSKPDRAPGEAAEGPEYGPPAPAASRPVPRAASRRTVRLRVLLSQGVGWWHPYPNVPVIGSLLGSLGIRYRWFEAALVLGDPAWGAWGLPALLEVGLQIGLITLETRRLRLAHRFNVSAVYRIPDRKDDDTVLVRMAPAVVAWRLWRQLRLELTPLAIGYLRKEFLATSLGLSYEL